MTEWPITLIMGQKCTGNIMDNLHTFAVYNDAIPEHLRGDYIEIISNACLLSFPENVYTFIDKEIHGQRVSIILQTYLPNIQLFNFQKSVTVPRLDDSQTHICHS